MNWILKSFLEFCKFFWNIWGFILMIIFALITYLLVAIIDYVFFMYYFIKNRDDTLKSFVFNSQKKGGNINE